MANPNQEAGDGDAGRETDESAVAIGETESGDEEMTDQDDVERDEDNAVANPSGDLNDEDWGFSSGRPKMSKETKIGLSLILVLLCAFGFVAYKKLNPENPRLADVKPVNTDSKSGKTASVKTTTEKTQENQPDPFAGQNSDRMGKFALAQDQNSADDFGANRDQTSGAALTNDESSGAKQDFKSTFANQFPSRSGAETQAETQNVSEATDPLENTFGSGPTTTSGTDTRSTATAGTGEVDNSFTNESTSQEQNTSNATIGSEEPGFGLDEVEEPQQTQFGSNNLNDADSGSFATSRPETSNPVVEDDPPGSEGVDDVGSPTGQQDADSADAASDIFGNPVSPNSGTSRDDVDSTRQLLDQEDQSSGADSGEQSFPTEAGVIPGNEESALGQSQQQTPDNDKRYGDYRPLETSRHQASSSTTVQRPTSQSSESFSVASSGQSSRSPQSEAIESQGDRTISRFGSSTTTSQNGQLNERNDANSNSQRYGSPVQNDSPAKSTFESPRVGTSETGTGDSFEKQRIERFAPGADSGFQSGTNGSSTQRQQSDFGNAYQPGRPSVYRSTGNIGSTPSSGEYKVQPNESYWIISKKLYGTARYFQALARHNQQRIPNPRRMRPGMKILTPSPSILEARYPGLFASRNQAKSLGSSSAGQTVAKRKSEPSGFLYDRSGQPVYRVGTEDTLTSISKDHLGRASRWIQIYRLNRNRLKNPDRLTIGTVLRLPSDASRVKLVRTPASVR